MATNSLLRFRRSAAQLHALACVEREIRAADSVGRRKYLRDFSESFRSYQSVLSQSKLESFLLEADVILVGDYHALPTAQHCVADLLCRLKQLSERPIALALEAIVASDQHIVDEWFEKEIGIEELRERIRFDIDWGYDWLPYRTMLEAVRPHAKSIHAIDCAPRTDMRSIAARDRHAAIKIAALREAEPNTAVMVLFGESHLAPTHLPALLRKKRPNDRIVVVLQNVDPLYWLAAGEPSESIDAVQVNSDVVCVFNASPLEKYERYRLCIEKWRQSSPHPPDLAPCFYNLIEALLRFLNINPHTTKLGRDLMLVDAMPEIVCRPVIKQIDSLLKRKRLANDERLKIAVQLVESGSAYIEALNIIVATDFRIEHASEQAARFVHTACSGALATQLAPARVSHLIDAPQQVVHEALSFLGSKIICPGRILPQPEQSIILVADVRVLGQQLGVKWYQEYLSGDISKRQLREMFIRPLERAGKMYREGASLMSAKQKHRQKKPMSTVSGKLKSGTATHEFRSTAQIA